MRLILPGIEILNELQAQVLEKGMCPYCHEKCLVDVGKTDIKQCAKCKRAFVV